MSQFVKNINDPKYYFDLACAERAKISLFFSLDSCHISNITATCAMVKNGHLVALAPIRDVEREPIVWGTETDAYFAVRDVDLVHCHFRSRVARIYNGPPEAIFLVFPIPETIDHKRRRFALRMPLSSEQSASFRVWHGEAEEKDDKLPALRWNALEPDFCVLGDISSAGLRLDLPEKHPAADNIGINDAVFLRGDFGSTTKSLPLSVIGLVSRKMPGKNDPGLIQIGCKFLKWRKTGARDTAWFKAEQNMGVSAIAQWISRNFRGGHS